MLSEDDRNLRELSDEELALAWDLWFDLAQTTNDADPPYTHGVFQRVRFDEREERRSHSDEPAGRQPRDIDDNR
jgi:hypothetical protein